MAEAGKLSDKDDSYYEVEKILNRRKTKKGKIQYLIRWKNFTSAEDTWEPLSNLGNCRQFIDEFNDEFDHKKFLEDETAKVNRTSKKVTDKNHNTKTKDNINDECLVHRTGKRRRIQLSPSVDLKLMNGHISNCHRSKQTQLESPSSSSDIESIEYVSDVVSSPDKSPSNSLNNICPNGKSLINRSFSVTNHKGKPDAEFDFTTPVKRHRFSSLRSSDEKKIKSDYYSISHSAIVSPNIFSKSIIDKPLSPVVKLHDLRDSVTPGTSGLNREKQPHHEEDDDSEKDRRVSLRLTGSLYKFKEIVVRQGDGYTQVWFFTSSTNRNSLNPKVFNELITVLTNSKNDNSSVFLLHGTGNIFCSGIDLKFLAHRSNETRKKAAKQMADALRKFIDALINFPKIIIAAVNGTATGLGAAILPLCDIVYASDKAVFSTPYGCLSQVPEGCSSVTFPTTMGHALANEMLIGGRKLTALEAYSCGLVSHVFWPTSLMQEVLPRVQSIVTNSTKAMQMSKSLIRGNNRTKMENANESECSMLAKCWTSLEGYKAIERYIEKNKDVFI